MVKPATEADEAAARAAATANGFSGDPLMRKPFVFRTTRKGDVLELEVGMGFSPEEMVRILSAPTSMTSEALAHWLPKLQGPNDSGLKNCFKSEPVIVVASGSRAYMPRWSMS